MIFLVSACFIFSDRVSTCCARNRQNSGFCKLLVEHRSTVPCLVAPQTLPVPSSKGCVYKIGHSAMRCAVSLPPLTLPDRPFQKAERDRSWLCHLNHRAEQLHRVTKVPTATHARSRKLEQICSGFASV